MTSRDPQLRHLRLNVVTDGKTIEGLAISILLEAGAGS